MVADGEKLLRCTIAAPGVEVVTVRDRAGELVSTIHGGALDGQELRAGRKRDTDRHHQWACALAAGDPHLYN